MRTIKNTPSAISKTMLYVLVGLSVSGFYLNTSAQVTGTQPVPQHLLLARELQTHVVASENSYQHSENISLPSDTPAQQYTMFADCSGLVIALLDRAQSPARQRMSLLHGHKRPLAEDFVRSIQQAHGFTRITSINNVHPGDIIAWEFQWDGDKKIAKDTGHVMIVDSTPALIADAPPLVADTTQYELFVIDSSRNYHDPGDTRIQSDGKRIQGLGRGKIRLYVSTEGEIVGYANNFKAAMFQPFDPKWAQFSTGKSKIGAIGRADVP